MLLLASLLLAASSEVVPAGEVVQIKFYLAHPAPVAGGTLSIDFDSQFFGDVIDASAFSATGDAHGDAEVKGRHVDVHFASGSGGIGIINGLPVAVVRVPTLPGLPTGAAAAVTANVSLGDTATVAAGKVTIGGTLSIHEVQRTGDSLRILGSGFTPSTAVEIEGAVISSTRFAGPREIEATLGGPTEITGKRLRVRDRDSVVEFFPALPGKLIFPLQACTAAGSGDLARRGGNVAIYNPNREAVDVRFQEIVMYQVVRERLLKIPGGGTASVQWGFDGGGGRVRVLASMPVRSFLRWALSFHNLPTSTGSFSLGCSDGLPPLQLRATPASIWWVAQPGSAPPRPQSLSVGLPYEATVPSARFTASASTESGGNWLAVTPSSGTTGSGAQITVSADPTSLPPGIYRGTISVKPEFGPDEWFHGVEPTLVSVALTVSEKRFENVAFAYRLFGGASSSTINVPADVIEGPFVAAVLMDGGGDWLSASPSAGVSPAPVTISAKPGNLPAGRYTGEVLISGAGGTLVVSCTLSVGEGLLLRADDFVYQFSDEQGGPSPPPAKSVRITPGDVPFTASVTTNSGGNWLAATPDEGKVSISVNSTGLAAGIYTGAVTLASPKASGPTQIPVVLVVRAGAAPALTADPPSLYGYVYSGGIAQTVCVSAGNSAVAFQSSATTDDKGKWLRVEPGNSTTFGCVQVGIDARGLAPGTHTGAVRFATARDSVTLPVKVVIPAGAPVNLGSVVNAASGEPGAIAPGEIVAIRGSGLNGREVKIGGMPARVLFSSPTQINAAVPEGIAGPAELRVGSAGWTLPAAAAAPGIFTADYSGRGQAAALNADGSLNSPSNPAPRGSSIRLFATGLGGLPVRLLIGGVETLAAGDFQIDATIPSGIETGPAIPVLLSVGPYRSQSGVTIAVTP